MAIPIPKRPCGYKRGSPSAHIHIEAFIDLECTFSRRSWNTLLKLTHECSPGDVNLIVHPIALPQHRQSWDLALAANAIAGGEDELFFEFTTHLFEHQHLFRAEAFRDKSHIDLQIMLADLAADFSIIHRNNFLPKLNSKTTWNTTKAPMRYASLLGVWSTPTFFINSAEVPALLAKSTVEDWRQILDPLLHQS